MKEAYAVTGYVPSDVAKKLKAKTPGNVEVSPERGVHPVFMQVDGSDVTEVRVGATSGGQTLVQLILRDEAAVQTIMRLATTKGVNAFVDPSLARLTAAAVPNKIFV
jgi:hypothetical protein